MQLPVPASPVPEDALTEAQWATLSAFCEAIIPSIRSDHPSDRGSRHNAAYQIVSAEDIERTKADIRMTTKPDATESTLEDDYLRESPSSYPAFKEAVFRFIGRFVDQDNRNNLLFVLNALSYRAGSLLLTGRSRLITEMSIPERQTVLQEWGNAYLPMYRDLQRSLTQLTVITWIRTSPTLGRLITYPHTPVNHNFGEAFAFDFVQIPTGKEQEVIETDIVIVGSGCTGAVAASVLSQAGLSVMVVDKSYYWPPSYLPMTEMEASLNLFQNGGVTQADGGRFSVISGSCWGGGGTINWSASLHLQHPVRQEWARSSGLPYFTSPAFQADMDAVCDVMGVSTEHVVHNSTNKVLMDGARLLGMSGKTVPQNTGGKSHQCGYCTLGCGSCEKRGPTESWLPDAAKHGAKFMEGFSCDRIVFEGKRAIGVEGVWTSRGENRLPGGSGAYTRPLLIKARKAVISASGALGTPVLLKRSGLTNPHIGAHLKLHPVSVLGAIFPEPTFPWEGSILTGVVTDLENQDGHNHGVKLEACTMLPSWFLPQIPWTGGLEWKALSAKFRHATGYISLARDSGEGQIYVDPKDPARPRIIYDVCKKDRQHIAAGLEALAKINYIKGAKEIIVAAPGVPPFVRDASADTGTEETHGVNDPRFREWLEKYVHPMMRSGAPARDTCFASAHQMGSARMGSTPQSSAVDGAGRVWGKQGLYVVDTSVFPAASGVNPMITGMATARGIARGIVRIVR
ncbi:long-chain fatty alcohol dehydrogenase [Myriangium duriaei CBS 260.36]|uniref:Long-chain-alcohol oxidase n=1 Tax=Myriangium duriaei CBS 260.36 TaxID=1168546 RepID=A0A9P4IUA5_9PEZI|nr:long-chain fatty alcohol dehydrogenase [Myriangium duriaei CBS 260.36]